MLLIYDAFVALFKEYLSSSHQDSPAAEYIKQAVNKKPNGRAQSTEK